MKDMLRIDRATLAPGRTLADGAVVRQAILARADVEMLYPHGREVATVEALSDPEYLASLSGLAVVAKHPDPILLNISDPSTYDEVGTVLRADWLEDEKAVRIEVVIRDAEANRAIESGQNGVSEGYAVTSLDASGPVVRQLGRRTNHVALTLGANPRMRGARIRADEEDTMKIEMLTAILALHGLRADSEEHLKEDLKKALDTTALDEAKTRADEAEQKLAEIEPLLQRVDSTEALDAAVIKASTDLMSLHKRAAECGVRLDSAPKTVADVRTELAIALGGDKEQCKDQGFAQGVISTYKRADSAEKPSDASTWYC